MLFYCIVQKVCKKCEKIEFKRNKNYFDVVNELCEFIFLQKNSVWVAHNGGRFDTIFI